MQDITKISRELSISGNPKIPILSIKKSQSIQMWKSLHLRNLIILNKYNLHRFQIKFFFQKPSFSNHVKPMQKTKSHFFPNMNASHSAKTSQDVKSKGKIVSEPKVLLKRSETNPKIIEKKIVKQHIHNKQRKISSKDKILKDNRIMVFQIKRKTSTTLVKRSYLVDVAITFSMKTSRGPKQLWVPKSAWFPQVIRDEQFESKWFIDSGCSRHMTWRPEELR